MSKRTLAILGAALIAICVTSSSFAQQRNRNGSDDHNFRYRDYRSYQGQREAPVRGRYDPNSLDGRRTGQPRTCGSDFMLYDPYGVPHGPYCN